MTADPFAFDDLLLSRVRLGIVAALIQSRSATFPELKDALGVTQGNLGAHLDKLEAGGYVSVTKAFSGRRPSTTVKLTRRGRAALRRHVDRLASLSESAPATGARPARRARRSV